MFRSFIKIKQTIKQRNKKRINSSNSNTTTIFSLLIAILTVVISSSNLYLYYHQQNIEKERAKREHPNLVITQLHGGDPSLHFKLLKNEDRWTKYPYRVMLLCRLENLSEKPITITTFDLESEINTLRSDSVCKASDTDYELYNFYDENGIKHYWTYNIGKKQLLPLIVLEPWGAKEGPVFFITGKDMLSDEINGKLRVTTTRGIFSTNVRIHKASSYYSQKEDNKLAGSL